MLNTYYFLTGVQTLLITFICFLYRSKKIHVNQYLGYFFLTLFLEVVKIILLKIYKSGHLLFLPLSFNFLTIVFLFFYASETAGFTIKNKRRYYIFAIVEFFLFSFLYVYLWFDYGLLKYLFTIGFMDVYMLSSSAYIIFFCFRIIEINFKHQRRIKSYFKNKTYKTLHWLTVFCVMCLMFNLMGFLGKFIFLENESYLLFYEGFYLFSLYYVAISSLLQINIDNVIDSNKLIFSGYDLSTIFDKIEKIMVEKKLYLNPNLNLKLISQETEIPMRLISKAINEIKKKNFNAYVHEYRIEEFKKLILKKDYLKYSIEALANEVGYNSRASFYKNFKKIVGVSPLDFINEKRNQ
ncbi:helix-turn-helix domain-containing protein [Tenacibaculum sp. C7A-26P2]|uniref:helix-turn-helix domain-containing protein n=1 Tax=Tenacibaculum sp. C7A-26P2 TaxID=3447504 RepID=UPI003F836A7F